MGPKTILSYALVLMLLSTIAVSQYRTLPDRTESVDTLCAEFESRDLVSEEDRQQKNDYEAAMEAEFGSGYFFILSVEMISSRVHSLVTFQY